MESKSGIQLSGQVVNLSKITAGANSLTFCFHTADESVESLGMYSLDDIQKENQKSPFQAFTSMA